MNAEQFQGLLRAVASGLGGYLAGKGIDANIVAFASGLVLLVGTSLWSYLSNKSGKTIA